MVMVGGEIKASIAGEGVGEGVGFWTENKTGAEAALKCILPPPDSSDRLAVITILWEPSAKLETFTKYENVGFTLKPLGPRTSLEDWFEVTVTAGLLSIV
jgi:hypothetical protein